MLYLKEKIIAGMRVEIVGLILCQETREKVHSTKQREPVHIVGGRKERHKRKHSNKGRT